MTIASSLSKQISVNTTYYNCSVSITRLYDSQSMGSVVLGVKGDVSTCWSVSPTNHTGTSVVVIRLRRRSCTRCHTNKSKHVKQLCPGLNDSCLSNRTTMPWINSRRLFLCASALFLVASLSDSQGESRHPC